MRGIAALALVPLLALLACSGAAPHGATPPDCHADAPEPGVCSPLRPTV